MNRAEQERLYRDQMGDEALLRQLVEGNLYHTCCGELATGPHNPDCRHNPVRRAEKVVRQYYGDTATEGAANHGN